MAAGATYETAGGEPLLSVEEVGAALREVGMVIRKRSSEVKR
jgi:hypothetical protein